MIMEMLYLKSLKLMFNHSSSWFSLVKSYLLAFQFLSGQSDHPVALLHFFHIHHAKHYQLNSYIMIRVQRWKITVMETYLSTVSGFKAHYFVPWRKHFTNNFSHNDISVIYLSVNGHIINYPIILKLLLSLTKLNCWGN